jgi:hypothetical protein
MPVLADEDGLLLAGHARVAAAAKLGLHPSRLSWRGWSEDEKRAYRLADNQLAARASWCPEQLSKELCDLKLGGFELGLIGFEPDQLKKFLDDLGSNGRTDPDSVPELPDQANYDPFLGSGTSLIAAEMSDRICYGLELDPSYVDVVVRRWQRFTGRDATDQASGQSFDERAGSQEPIAEDPTMARTAFVVDEAMRERVRYLAGVGLRLDDIARIIRLRPEDLAQAVSR